jgi:hypothetical protein
VVLMEGEEEELPVRLELGLALCEEFTLLLG